jgi:DNA-binding NarL/FixJ family response regulator
MIIDERRVLRAERRNLSAYVNNGANDLGYAAADRGRPRCSRQLSVTGRQTIPDADHFDQDRAVLSSREREILELVVDGQSAKAIAQRTGLSPRTVERHIENCRHKLRARNTAQLVSKALESGALG